MVLPDRQMRNVAKFDPKRPTLVHLHISWNLNAVFALAVLAECGAFVAPHEKWLATN